MRRVLRRTLGIVVGVALYVIGWLVSLMALIANPWVFDSAGMLNGLGVVLALLLGVVWVSVFVRRRWPLVPFIAGAVLAAAWCDALLMLIGLFHVLIRSSRRQAITASLIGTALVVLGVVRICVQSPGRNPFVLLFLDDPDAMPGADDFTPTDDALFGMTVVTILAGVLGSAVSIGVGYLLRRTCRMTAIESAARRQEQRNETLTAELARRSERELLARELHDTLSHRLSVISLHSGALEVGRRDEATVTATASALRREAHASLEDLRHLVGGVREGTLAADGPLTGHSAVPGTASMRAIPHLIETVQATGTIVRPSIIIEDVDSASTIIDRAVYRIVQESLTNAMKHAPGAPVTLEVSVSAALGIRILVANPAPPTRRPDDRGPVSPTGPGWTGPGTIGLSSTGSGAGLEGIRERAAILEGRAEIGIRDGHFVVEVSLPPFSRHR